MSVFLQAATDRSGTTAAGAKEVAPASTTRRGLIFQNTGDADMRLTENGAAATATTGFLVKAGETFRVSTSNAISVYSALANKTYAATEF